MYHPEGLDELLSRPVYRQSCTAGAVRQGLAGAAAGRAAERSPAGGAGPQLQSALERGVWPHLPATARMGSCRHYLATAGCAAQCTHLPAPASHALLLPVAFGDVSTGCQGKHLEIIPEGVMGPHRFTDALVEFDNQGELLATNTQCGTAVLRYTELRAASLSGPK